MREKSFTIHGNETLSIVGQSKRGVNKIVRYSVARLPVPSNYNRSPEFNVPLKRTLLGILEDKSKNVVITEHVAEITHVRSVRVGQ